MSARILVVDDDLETCRYLADALGSDSLEVLWRTHPAEALMTVEQEPLDAVLTDLNMKGMNGVELCARINDVRPDVPVIVLTAFGSLEAAVEAIRAGAYDFLAKPFEIEQLRLVIDRAVRHRALTEEVRRLREMGRRNHNRVEEILTESRAMRRVIDMIARIADSISSVLVTGESGTGKELVAKALHHHSSRRERPFVAVNCAALPETLLESELFGHERGAFTDAHAAREGLLLQADGGTLFLDEIGDMPPAVQVKLLRALEERKVRPVGGTQEKSFNVRLVTATHQDLDALVEQGRFREDLYFRINVIHIELPPLRARDNDVLLLAQHFIREFAGREGKAVVGLSPEAAAQLISYAWPGNVRELRNCIERAVALCRYDHILVGDLPDRLRERHASRWIIPTDDPSELLPLEEVERRYILRVLEAHQGNKSSAARVLGLDRKTLYRKLEGYGVRDSTDQ